MDNFSDFSNSLFSSSNSIENNDNLFLLIFYYLIIFGFIFICILITLIILCIYRKKLKDNNLNNIRKKNLNLLFENDINISLNEINETPDRLDIML